MIFFKYKEACMLKTINHMKEFMNQFAINHVRIDLQS